MIRGMNKPRLYLFVGYPGAGKTTVAQALEEATGAVHLWADDERHKMFPNPTHSHQESTELYERLNERAEELLKAGKSVIFDTNFNFYNDREHLRQIAERSGAEAIVIWVTTPKEISKKRAVQSDMTRNGYEVLMSEQQFDDIVCKLEPPTESEKVLKIDGTNFDKQELMRLLSQ
ncbi:MAG: hypothetical protein JWL89_43 [Candidatus Saccharibacteria bacterium]|nr:hypothetical protein [Candidatus Saccharibacteria bacterium]